MAATTAATPERAAGGAPSMTSPRSPRAPKTKTTTMARVGSGVAFNSASPCVGVLQPATGPSLCWLRGGGPGAWMVQHPLHQGVATTCRIFPTLRLGNVSRGFGGLQRYVLAYLHAHHGGGFAPDIARSRAAGLSPGARRHWNNYPDFPRAGEAACESTRRALRRLEEQGLVTLERVNGYWLYASLTQLGADEARRFAER